MKEQGHHARHHVGLILVLVGLVIGIALPLASTNVAAAVEQSDSSSISSAHAQENSLSSNRWSSNGPDGGSVLALAIDRSNTATIYAGTPTGVFKSTNGGESWSSSLTNSYVHIVAIAPTTPTTLYAAGGSGIYKSTDGGTSWNAVNNGLENQYGPVYIAALAIDPTNSNIIYVSGPDIEVGGTYRAIYKSTDGGGSWSITKHSINPYAIHRALAIDPINPNIIYAAGSVGNGTVWKSTDNGRFWTIVNVGLDSRSTVYALTIDPTNTNTIYVGTETLGVYKSTDGGASWSPFSDGLDYYYTDDNGQRNFFRVSSIVIDPINPSIVYVGTYHGVYKSSNGASWDRLMTGINLGVNAVAIDPGNTSIMYAGTDGGMFKSTSAGASWSTINKGVRGINVSSLALNTGNADVYAGTYGGTFSSNDNGGNWIVRDFYPLAFDPRNPNTIYARRDENDGLFKSTNGGVTWTNISTGLPDPYVYAVAVDPGNSQVIYTSTGGSLCKSTDGGENWTALASLGGATSLIVDPSNSMTLYAIAYDGYCDDNSVFRSTDGGLHWNSADSTLSFCGANALVLDPISRATIYVSSYYGIYKSTDGGEHWSRINSGLPEACASYVCAVSSLAVNPVHPNTVYGGTYGNGVFESEDGGATWNPFNDGLTNLNINALAIDASGNFLHAGTPAGVFDYQNSATGSEPVVLTADQVTLKSWTYQGRTYAYVKLSFPNSGYRVANWGQVVRSGNDFTVDARVERFTGPSIQSVVTTAQIYDLGPLAVGTYNFNFKTSGTLTRTFQFTVTGTAPPPNPIDDAREFVRSQYKDFLNREPDGPGWDHWTGEITQCTSNPATRLPGESDAACIVRQRANTSAAFFLSPEFQNTGYFVLRVYRGSLNRMPFFGGSGDNAKDEFTRDTAAVSAGIVVNDKLSPAVINANKQAFVNQFVTRAEFLGIYGSLSNAQYVDKLFQTTGVVPTSSERQQLIDGLGSGTETKASVLFKIADGTQTITDGALVFNTTYGHAFYDQQFNPGFVQMEYFGYMKRDPDDGGYAFWLGKLNQFGNWVDAQMVLAFIASPEYRAQFGQP